MAVNDTGLQLSAAQALVNVGQFDRAATFLQHAEARDANNYRLHAIRGQIASLQARNQDAIREYRIAIEHLPEGVPEGPLYPISLHLSLSELYRGADEQAGADRKIRPLDRCKSNVETLEQRNELLDFGCADHGIDFRAVVPDGRLRPGGQDRDVSARPVPPESLDQPEALVVRTVGDVQPPAVKRQRAGRKLPGTHLRRDTVIPQ